MLPAKDTDISWVLTTLIVFDALVCKGLAIAKFPSVFRLRMKRGYLKEKDVDFLRKAKFCQYLRAVGGTLGWEILVD